MAGIIDGYIFDRQHVQYYSQTCLNPVQHQKIENVTKCQQLFGGYGYMTEYPIANMFAGARVESIYGGTTEIMKELISRSWKP